MLKKILFFLIISYTIGGEKIYCLESLTKFSFQRATCSLINLRNVNTVKKFNSTVEKKTIRILSIDGGGIRGLIPLTILERIEERTGRSASGQFDIIAGTSTGGIIALALNVANKDGTAKHSASSLKDLYLNNNHSIFSQPNIIQRNFTFIWNFFAPKYSTNALEDVLKEKFEDTLLSESKSIALVTACNLKNASLHVFNSYKALQFPGDNYYMRDVARATSAAPTYFAPCKIKPHYRNQNGYIEEIDKPLGLIDGGIAANNPTFLAYSYARLLFPEANDYMIVSLGTGTRTIGYTKYSQLKGSGFWGWARKLPRLMINGSSSANEHYISVLMSELNRNPHTSCRYYPFRFSQLDTSSNPHFMDIPVKSKFG